jgi:hypothetical protein
MSGQVTVEAHAHTDSGLLELIQELCPEKGAVGLDPPGHVDVRSDGRPDRPKRVQDRARAAEERLTAVKDHPEAGDLVRARMLGYAGGNGRNQGTGHCPWLGPPGLVG